MTRTDTERWLGELQARFSAVLRAPLSAAGGTLHSDPRSYPAGAIDDVAPSTQLTASERLGVYQRQYWMRLLCVLQEQYPLTMHLCGAWNFNQLGIAYLSQEPPRGRDLGNVAEGFEGFLQHMRRDAPLQRPPAAPLPYDALREAACMDAAFRHVFMAPEEPAFHPLREAADDSAKRRLRISHAFARVDEHRPLLELRARVCTSPETGPVALPPLLAARRSWALFRTQRGVAHAALEPEQARLLELLEAYTLGDALALLESECEPNALAGLPERTQRFFAIAVQHGFFSGFD